MSWGHIGEWYRMCDWTGEGVNRGLDGIPEGVLGMYKMISAIYSGIF
jgi:hypothetical protein